MNIGLAVKKARTKKGVKQYALAEDSGITQSYLSTIEGGIKKPSLDVLEKICESLKVPLSVLIWWAVDIQDVSEDKQDSFKLVAPMVDGLIEEYLI